MMMVWTISSAKSMTIRLQRRIQLFTNMVGYSISRTRIFSDDVHCLSIGFSSEQMIDMLKAAGLQNPQVQVTTQRIVHSY